VVCLSTKPAAVYRPRRPRQSPLYRTIERYYPEFERTYDERYAKRYGPWRLIIGEVVRKFLRCGDLHFGFARVRCPDCRHEMFVAFSCQQRCLCPSCHQERTLLAAETIAETICAPVPHRQFVFTIPKRLRIYCRYDRSLLGELARAAWQATAVVLWCTLRRAVDACRSTSPLCTSTGPITPKPSPRPSFGQRGPQRFGEESARSSAGWATVSRPAR